MIICRYDGYESEYDLFCSNIPKFFFWSDYRSQSPLSVIFCLAHFPSTANRQRCRSLRGVGD